jgi:hypothetical protein
MGEGWWCVVEEGLGVGAGGTSSASGVLVARSIGDRGGDTDDTPVDGGISTVSEDRGISRVGAGS